MNWLRFFIQADADIITGYNIINFDMPYLLDRAKALKLIDFPFLGRIRASQSTMKNSKFESKAFGIRENKEIRIEGRIQFDVLEIIRRDYKLRSYTLNAVSAHFLASQKEDVHHCFPQADHQILTRAGFQSFNEVKKQLTHPNGVVHVACPVEDGLGQYRLEYHPITLKDLVDKTSSNLVAMRSKADKKSAMDLIVTGEHRMLVKVGSKKTVSASDYQKPYIRAGELVASAAEVAQFLCNTAGGVADSMSHLPMPFASKLNLTTDDQIDAFIEFYGQRISKDH